MGIMRVEQFITNLNKNNDCLTVCLQEKEYLDHNYSTLPTRKKAYSTYRKAIKEDSLLCPLIINKCLKIFTLTKLETYEYKWDYQKAVCHDHDNLKNIYNHLEYIKVAISLLDRNSYSEQVLGFAALTGRRVAEIGCSAEFKIVDDYEVIFTGQLKAKDSSNNKPYKIPLLVDAIFLVKKFNEFRSAFADRNYLNNFDRFHNNVSKRLSHDVKKHFCKFVEGNIKPKDLRAIYATICCHLYKPKTQTEQRYIALILGHSENDIVTCNSYFDYRLEV